MLYAEDIDRAAEVVAAMAAIPCLRGGTVTFDDDNLEAPKYWPEDYEWWNVLWVPVPDDPHVDCRVKIEVAIEEARRSLVEMIDTLAGPVPDNVAGDREVWATFCEYRIAQCRERLDRLEMAR